MNKIFKKRLAFSLIFMLATFLYNGSAQAFSVPIHGTMTKRTLAGITVNVGGQPRVFSEDALEDISKHNGRVDFFYAYCDFVGLIPILVPINCTCGGSAAIFHPERHFTNEEFAAASIRLIELKRQTLAVLRGGSPIFAASAWKLLGRALHNIQDFYSHSNWLALQQELDTFEINMDLGRSALRDPPRDDSPEGQNNPALNLPACFSDNPDQYRPITSPDQLSSGYFVGFGSTDRIPFIDEIGPLCGRPTDPGRAGCGPLPFNRKCYHGDYSEACPGTNTDRPETEGGPPDHPAARRLAELATRDYVLQIVEELRGNERALRTLLSARPRSNSLVIDRSQSMSEELDAIKGQVSVLATQFGSQTQDAAPIWVFVPFDDPDVGSALVTDSVATLEGAVNSLVASGGAGDCPELAQTALLEAISTAPDNGKLFLFTDAGTKDASLVNMVVSLAQAKSIEINAVLTGTCSPVDEALIRIVADSGGRLFVVDPSEIGAVFAAIGPRVSGDPETILSAEGTLAGSLRRFDLPVESGATALVVSLTSDAASNLSLRRPSGNLASPSDPDVTLSVLSSGVIVSVDGPEPGLWQAEIGGAGAFSLMARGIGTIEFIRFDMVTRNIDVHGGFFPIPGQPLSRDPGFGKAVFLGPVAAASFALVDASGQTIQEISLGKNFPEADPESFVGEFTLPSVPFRVVATGVDESGFPFQRQYQTLYRPQTLLVAVESGIVESVPAGQLSTFEFTVANLGQAGTFRIDTFDDLGFISAVNPTVVSLAEGQSETITVDVNVPATVRGRDDLTVTVVAVDTADANVFNSASLDLTVRRDTPPECSSEPPKTVTMWPPNHKFVSVDVAQAAGIVVPGGNPVTITIDSVTQDEPVDAEGNGDGSTAPDAIDDGSGVLLLRSERDGKGNGRVYRVAFTASDQDGSCTGTLFAEVPHDRSGRPVINDGTSFNSILP